jgi:hypothetical protein
MSLITWIMRRAVASLYVKIGDGTWVSIWGQDQPKGRTLLYALIKLLTRPRKTILLPVRG